MIRTDPASALAASLVQLPLDAVPPAVVHEAKRALFNVLAVAVGGSAHPGVDAIVRVGKRAGGPPAAPVIGRTVRLDAHFAALATGFAAHVDDYDDTHLATVIHPAAPIVAAVLPLGSECGASGAAAMLAFIAGCETALRIGVAVSPAHYDAGWHITGTCGALGAAAAAGLLLGLDAERLAAALGFAAASASGAREAFGSMAKGYHAGKAAANGIRAARLAAAGERVDPGALAAFADAAASAHAMANLDTAFGERYELALDAYKPYPCGVVAHPAIDAAIAVAPRVPSLDAIVEVVVACHPLVPELMGQRTPQDGLQARFSAVHGVAAGLRERRVGLAQYDEAYVHDATLAALRERVRLDPDAEIARDAARITVRLADGSTVSEAIAHARGSAERPLTDRELAEKAAALLEPVLPGRIGALRSAVSELASAPDLTALAAAVTP